MKKSNVVAIAIFFTGLMSCADSQKFDIEIMRTDASGAKLEKIETIESGKIPQVTLTIDTSIKKQRITGFGGSFTEASAYLLNQLSQKNREQILQAYFGKDGANYSLTRTHINSCDFSLSNYAYCTVDGDTSLVNFSIDEDKDDIIPMIKEALTLSEDGFKIISSPWTAPPWMKDNKYWRGGKLLPQYYDTWALYFSKYIEAYKAEGIDIWGVTVENEPLGNNNNWESMHYTPEEMTQFVVNHLGPKLRADFPDVKILGYDQNRGEELKHWVDVMFASEDGRKYYDGTAVHWYASTYDYFGESLTYAHQKAPQKFLIQSEACVDAEVPKWKDDEWYWSKEATDWGWDWATEENKHLHPKYAPVHRYARDIIGCLNNWVDGWIDWNMVLDTQGGPNWFENWCVAPCNCKSRNG
jgi:glucosylceramidase